MVNNATVFIYADTEVNSVTEGGIGVPNNDELTTDLSTKADISSLAQVALSGSFTDLINVPTHPTLDDVGSILTNSVVLPNTISNQIGISIDSTVYRSIELSILLTYESNYHTAKIFAFHDNVNVFSEEIVANYNNSLLATFDLTIVNNSLQLLITPNNANTKANILAIVIKN